MSEIRFKIYVYTSSQGNSHHDNCLISRRPADELITAHDLDFEPGWELHKPNEDSQRCRTNSQGPEIIDSEGNL